MNPLGLQAGYGDNSFALHCPARLLHWLTVSVALGLLLCPVLNAWAKAPHPEVDYSLEVIVVDKVTGLPISGAYVALIYRRAPTTTDDTEDRANPLNGACRKVKGGYTAEDGSVLVRGGDAEGLVYRRVYAIKNGYFIAENRSWTAPRDRTLRDATGTRFELTPRGPAGAPVPWELRDAQDAAFMSTSMFSLDCWLASYREDALPAVPFLDMLLADFKVYYDKGMALRMQNDIGRIKYLFSSLPAKPKSSPR